MILRINIFLKGRAFSIPANSHLSRQCHWNSGSVNYVEAVCYRVCVLHKTGIRDSGHMHAVNDESVHEIGKSLSGELDVVGMDEYLYSAIDI